MAVIVLVSAAGSPGVTTTAVGLALTWPRPVLLVEADPTGGSAVLAGFFRGAHRTHRRVAGSGVGAAGGLVGRGAARGCRCRFPDSSASLLPGVRSHAQSRSLAGMWEPLTATLKGLGPTGRT